MKRLDLKHFVFPAVLVFCLTGAPTAAKAASYSFGFGYGGYGYSSGFASFHYRNHPYRFSTYYGRHYLPSRYVLRVAPHRYYRPYRSYRSYPSSRYYRRVYSEPYVYTEPVVKTERVVTTTVTEPETRIVTRQVAPARAANSRPIQRNMEGRPQYSHSNDIAIPQGAALQIISSELAQAGLEFDQQPEYEVSGSDLEPDFVVHDSDGNALAIIEYWSEVDASRKKDRLDQFDKLVAKGTVPVFFIQSGHRAAISNEASGIAELIAHPDSEDIPETEAAE